MKLVLASGSPRRKELLSLIRGDFLTCPVDVDEHLIEGAQLADEVLRLSEKKARAALSLHPDALCIGSDTMVTIDGLALGKPQDRAQAEEMLRRLSGRTHEVLTGLCACSGTACKTYLSRTNVRFVPISEKMLADYLDSGEPMDKAGAYGIQGRGAVLIDGIDGDYYAVMGLPVAPLYQILDELGVK